MRRIRVYLYLAAICLPAVLLVAFATWAGVTVVPRLIRNEPRRVTLLYRDDVERNREGGWFEVVEKRPKGSAVGKVNGQPWGYYVKNGRARVWYREVTAEGRTEWRLAPTARHDPYPWGLVAYGGGGAFVGVFCLLTAAMAGGFLKFEKARDDFLAATAHDLTTPLVGLRLTIGRDDETAKILVERLMRLVTNIKDFMRIGGTRPSPKVATFDLRKAYREAYALFADDFRDHFGGEDVAVEGAEEALPVRADETMTIQILWNLIGNDLKYAAPYGRVRAAFWRARGRVCLALADEGPGLTRHQRRRAFDRYYRAKTVLETGKGGFGIGLCTAREFARAMGGDLTVVENVPKGCVFALSLPAANMI